DQPAFHQILDHGRKAGLVAPIGERQLRLADAGIARDQSQSSEPPRPFADLRRKVGERLESSLLRHAEVEADPMREWTKIDRQANGFAVPAAPAAACPVCGARGAWVLQHL